PAGGVDGMFAGGGAGTLGGGPVPAGRASQAPGGGFLSSSTPGSALVAKLRAVASRYTWVAAVVDSNSAAGYQLASGDPVMAIGGFNGTDPVPTLAQFQAYVRQGSIHYFISDGRRGGGFLGGGDSSSQASAITTWVQQNFASQTVDGVTVYDLTTVTSG